MGKKAKLGKRRKDKFYHLAKEAGYRARSAFKLVQLNRKFNFLQSSRVLIDLCAAPGGWLQVAAKTMPISSLIVGVDLVPIKPIPNVISIQEDITSPRCKQLLQRELKTWKADCVLNDGAPNVGSAWVQDAFSQAELSLAALKLACSFLRDGGCFITKVFRSKDYQPLMWVLRQLFKTVHSTKPQASRLESAEIFVVCQGYLAPSSIDEKLLDPKHVFQELEKDTAGDVTCLSKINKPSKAAEGYPENAGVLFKSTPISEFVLKDNYLTILKETSKFVFDRSSEIFSRHPLTTDEIRQSCEDLKVLGTRELKLLAKWREKMRAFVDGAGKEEGEEQMEVGDVAAEEAESDPRLRGIDDRIKALADSEAAAVKREIRRLRKQRKKLKERLVVKGAAEESEELIRQENLFQLKEISRSGLGGVELGEEMSAGEEESLGEEESEEEEEEGGDGEKTDDDGGVADGGGGVADGGGDGGVADGGGGVAGGDGWSSGSSDSEGGDGSEDEDNEKASATKKVQPKKRKLDPEGLAIGAIFVQSKKKREDLIESGYNRWTHNDANLPDWFVESESKFCQKRLPISKDMVEVYRAKLREINIRPIKKVVEAKARKKKRALKRLEKAKKKAEGIVEASDVSDPEKAQQLRQLYKKAAAAKKSSKGKVEYVVAKKGVGKRVRRPPGIKGRFKVVDPRMKKDKRGRESSGGGRKSSGKGSRAGGGRKSSGKGSRAGGGRKGPRRKGRN